MSRWLGYTSVATLVAFVLSLLPAMALAAPPPASPAAGSDSNLMAAQLHYHAGRKAYDERDYETAIREWTEAQRIKASPKLDYNIGLAYEKLGRPREALAYYYRFLQQSPDASNRAEVEAKLPVLQAQVDQGGQPQGQPPPPNYQGQPPPNYQGQPPPPNYQGQPPPPNYQGQPPPPNYQGQPPGYYQAPPPVAAPYLPPPVRKRKRRLWWIVFPVVGGVGLIVTVALVARFFVNNAGFSQPALSLPPNATPALPPNDGALFRF